MSYLNKKVKYDDNIGIVIEESSNSIIVKDNTNKLKLISLNEKDVETLVDDNGPINLTYSSSDVEEIDDWSDDTGIVVIMPAKTEDELDDEWDKWNQQTKEQRDESDNKSLELFGITNYDHYIGLKNKFNGGDQYTDDDYGDYISTEENSQIRKYNTYNFSFFNPNEISSLGTYKSVNENYYNAIADNYFLDNEQKISTKMWFKEYQLYSQGIISENTNLYTRLWVDKLNELYSDYNKIKESGDLKKVNSRKQSILELGWNPEINFSIENRIKVNENMNQLLNEKYNRFNIIDLTKINDSILSEETIEPITDDKNKLYPIYIVLSFTYTKVGKVISKFTHSLYSHAAVSLDNTLDKLYSFNMVNHVNKSGGFSLESIKGYLLKNKESRIVVYTLFVKQSDILKIKMKLDYFLSNIKNTSYSIFNLFSIAANKAVEFNNSMVCSQFVDSLLKLINVDITNKPSALVSPKDLSMVENPKIYKVYEGLIKDYDQSKVNKTIKSLQSKAKAIKESSNEFECIYEIKEFPVQFDKEGNLLIKTMKTLDFEHEFAKSHKLLVIYEKEKNLEGIKYELSKLWFMNNILENRIYNEKHNEKDIQSYHKARSKILNDFKKYLKLVTSEDKEFNFTEYYNNTPFSSAKIKINSSTLKYSGEALKNIVKLLI